MADDRSTGLGKLVRRWFGGSSEAKREAGFRARFPLPAELEAWLERIERESTTRKGGGSSRRKQRVLAHTILEHGLQRSLEIGVFAGSSLFPQALAMKRTGGLAIGVDPWSAGEAEQKDNLERILPDLGEGWSATVDWDGLHREVGQRLERYGLAAHCRLIRATSAAAGPQVEGPLDLVHVDGNHDYERCADDLARWLPRLRERGFLVLDDTSWDTIHPQYLALCERMELVWAEPMPGTDRPEWALLRTR